MHTLTVIGQDADEAFVLDYVQDNTREEPFFAILFTTPRLIDATDLTRPIEMDDTYKLIYENFTVAVMGQSDADRVFHTRAVGISTNSTEEVGRFYLLAWKSRVPLFCPRAYVGDAAAAYANAAAGVFDSILVRVMCFAHVYKVSVLYILHS